MALEKRRFGDTGLEVAVLGYGAMELRHDSVDDKKAAKLLGRLLDAGVNFIDTAPDYGKSEDVIGRLITDRRDEYVLATKCGCRVPGDPAHQEPRHAWNGERLMRNLESSLKRLKTDRIDIWQIHSAWAGEIENTDVLPTMQKAKEQGKVRFLAVSMKGQSPHHGKDMLDEYLNRDEFGALQVIYSALTRECEGQMLEAHRLGRGMIVRGVVKTNDELLAAFDKVGLDELRAENETRHQFLLRFSLNHPGLHTAIVGTSNPEHMAQNIAAAEAGPLPSDVLEEAKRRLDAAGFRPLS